MPHVHKQQMEATGMLQGCAHTLSYGMMHLARLMQPLETGAGAKEGQHSEVVFAVAAAEVLHMIIMHMQAVTWCVRLPVCP